MCGISGLYNFNGSPVDGHSINAMLEKMSHRGPDDSGIYLSNNFGMGIRRLSIIDIAGGHQPKSNEDNSYWIVLNGEIFNYIELRKEINGNHKFATKSDTEVILHLYEDKQDEVLKYLNGMFSFAIWNNKKRELFIARDRLGVKPLFYFHTDKYFAFSSELKSLLAILPFNKEIDYNSFSLYMYLAYVPDPLCMFKGINKLQPGHFLKIDSDGRLENKKYWDVTNFGGREVNKDADLREELLYLLNDAVMLQKRSDVPMGIFLSGGLDSSTIAALLSQQTSQPLRTYSVGYQGHQYDERPAARLVAGHFNTIHNELEVNYKSLENSLSDVAYYMDEPVYDSSSISMFLLSQMARGDGIKVIMNGTGGDEVFGGYNRYADAGIKRTSLKYLPTSMKAMLGRLLQYGGMTAGLRLCNPIIDYLCRISGNLYFLNRYLNDRNWQHALNEKMYELFSETFFNCAVKTEKSRRMYFDLKTYLVGDLLMLLDKMTMSSSIEGRVPLLDHRIVEFMFSLPDNYKVSGEKMKVLFRTTVSHILPQSLFAIPKRGFGAPLPLWIAQGVSYNKDMWYDLLKTSQFLNEHINIEQCITDLPHNISNNNTHNIEPFFALILFAHWHKRVLES